MWSLRRAWGRIPLWARLVVGALALLAVALTATGAVGAKLLRGYLTDQADHQLRLAENTYKKDPGKPFHGLYFVMVADARGHPDPDFPTAKPFGASLPKLTPRDITDAPRRPFTVSGTNGTRWRVFVSPEHYDGVPVYIVVSSNLWYADATVSRLLKIDLAVGGVVLVTLAVAGFVMVRFSLRPLRLIEQTAATIAAGDLSRRVPEYGPRTEVGRLSRSLNGMLSQIEDAFHAQQRSEAEARDSEQRMRRFVADASHELRTPLTSIRGFAELHRQRGTQGAEQSGELIGRIEDAATSMGLLVEDLLLLARLDQQRPLERAPVDLVGLAADVVIDARARAPEREIELAPIGIAEGEPVVVSGDGPRLRQILTNLVNNALTYTPEGTEVTVGVGFTDRAGRRSAMLQVADAGPGLSHEQAARIFERFYRADAARSRAQGGTGLGLSIVASLAAAHGGTAEVDTAPGEGAVFRVLLPVDG